MNTDTITIETLAAEAAAHFTTRTRGDDTITVQRDDAPEWVGELVRFAHGDFLPDDWRYATIRAALDWIAENGPESGGEFADSNVDVYTGARLAWLSSNLNRLSYCDEAGDDDVSDTADRIGWGQYVESSEVFSLVVSALESRYDELTLGEEDPV